MMKQVTAEFFPTKEQISRLLSVVGSGDYVYKDGIIKNKQLTSVNQDDLESLIKTEKKALKGAELKNYIYENDLVEEVLDLLGCGNVKFHGKYWSCSNWDGDNRNAINVRNHPYLGVKNWTRQNEFDDQADIITLTMYNKELTFPEAMHFLATALGIEGKELPQIARKQQTTTEGDCLQIKQNEEEYRALDEKTLDQYTPLLHIDWFYEGIMPWARDRFGIMFCYETNRIIIPMRHWKTGELLGINKRTTLPKVEAELRGIPKYQLTPSYPKRINLYGLFENMEEIKKAGYVVVYESEKSVLKRASLFDYTGVALSGKVVSVEQAQILLDLDVDIVISLDNDVNLQEIKEMCEARLYGKTKRKIFYTFDQDGVLGEKDSIADLPNDVFQKIMEQKVQYTEDDHMDWTNSILCCK